jgi:hypothetical protein
VLGTLLAILLIFALWQRETIYYILHPGKIQIKPADEIRAALLSGDFGPVEHNGGFFRYLVLDGAAEVRVSLDATLYRLEARFNAHSIPVGGVSDALDKASAVLSPYLTPPEINALGFLIAAELPGRVSANSIDYSREISGHTVTVTGRPDTGDMLVSVARLGESS